MRIISKVQWSQAWVTIVPIQGPPMPHVFYLQYSHYFIREIMIFLSFFLILSQSLFIYAETSVDWSTAIVDRCTTIVVSKAAGKEGPMVSNISLY